MINSTEPVWLNDEEVHALFTRLLDSYTAPAMVELRNRPTPDAELIYRPYYWILLDQPWHKGRTILIGDAAHATTAPWAWVAAWRWRTRWFWRSESLQRPVFPRLSTPS